MTGRFASEITQADLAQWRAASDAATPDLLEELCSQHTPKTEQPVTALCTGQSDGVILWMQDRDGNRRAVLLNAFLARQLAEDLLQAGVAMGWLDEDLTISTRPSGPRTS